MDTPMKCRMPKWMICPPTMAPSSTAIPAASTMMPRRRLLRENRAEAPARRMKLPQVNRSRMFSGVEKSWDADITSNIYRSYRKW